jgi:hypothetical protein
MILKILSYNVKYYVLCVQYVNTGNFMQYLNQYIWCSVYS